MGAPKAKKPSAPPHPSPAPPAASEAAPAPARAPPLPDTPENLAVRLARRFPPSSRGAFYGVSVLVVVYLSLYTFLRATDPRDYVRGAPIDVVSACFIAFSSLCLILSLHRVRTVDPGVVTRFDPVWGSGDTSFPPPNAHPTAPAPAPQAAFPLQRSSERRLDFSRRYCAHTRAFKPDRAHFCVPTARVVRRYDHHCIFLDASVGRNNHKFFLLFLLHTCLTAFATVWDLSVRAGLVAGFAKRPPGHSSGSVAAAAAAAGSSRGSAAAVLGYGGWRMTATLGIFVVGLAVGIALVMFLVFHAYLITTGTTTLEYGEKEGVVSHGNGRRYLSPYGQGLGALGAGGEAQAILTAAADAAAASVPSKAAQSLSPCFAVSPIAELTAKGPGVGLGLGAAGAAAAGVGAGTAMGTGVISSRWREVMGEGSIVTWFLPTLPHPAAAALEGGDAAEIDAGDRWAWAHDTPAGHFASVDDVDEYGDKARSAAVARRDVPSDEEEEGSEEE